jgi:hypothetical protein
MEVIKVRLDWEVLELLIGQITGPEVLVDIVRLLIRGFDQNPMLHT